MSPLSPPPPALLHWTSANNHMYSARFGRRWRFNKKLPTFRWVTRPSAECGGSPDCERYGEYPGAFLLIVGVVSAKLMQPVMRTRVQQKRPPPAKRGKAAGHIIVFDHHNTSHIMKLY